uniref:Omega-hydroxypalmitate O-feruloyl transferase n=1 Tax=Kalanchoe fedtschenkoi TaxID=63787 RepID=A0A7N0T5K7_KALFE
MASWVQELHLNPLQIPVTVDRAELVMPEGSIPVDPGDTLYLSNLDDIVGARVFTPTVYFYRPKSHLRPGDDQSVAGVLREALAKVLVPYYPFTGRLREIENGKLEIFFEAEQGTLMVEASCGLALADLGDLTVPNPSWLSLIHHFPDEEPYKVIDMPLLIAQVTVFGCGGFSLGLRICHCLCDGLGAMQFLKAWAEAATSGSLVADPAPCWDREFFRPRNPPAVRFPHTEFTPIEDGSTMTMSLWRAKPVQKCYRVSREFQAHLKNSAQRGTGNASDKFSCSTFDAMAAHIWTSWVKALDVQPPDFLLRLTFSVNARYKIKNPPLKEGFYGNAVCVGCAASPVSDLTASNLPKTTGLVRDARMSISEEYVRSTVDYVELHRPKRLEFGGKLTITQWTRFSIYESADFGWGRPVYAGPIDLTPTPQVCVLLPEGEAEKYSGAMVVCICLPEFAVDRFIECLCLMDSNSSK